MRWSFSRGSTGGKRKLHATGLRSSDKRFGLLNLPAIPISICQLALQPAFLMRDSPLVTDTARFIPEKLLPVPSSR